MATDNILPLSVIIAKLPPGFDGTPQELADAIAERIQVVTQQSFALFVTGSTEPSSDVGPWLKDGISWYYFDDDAGSYLPMVIPASALGYQISEAQPTDDGINFWIQIESDGTPVALKIPVVSGGSTTWESPYYTKAETFTTAEATEALLYQTRYAARAYPNANQTVPVDGTQTKITFNTLTYDTQNAYQAANSRYVAAVKGIYRASVITQWENNGATASGVQIGLAIIANGIGSGPSKGGNTVNIASPPGDRWNNAFSIEFSLEAGDFIEVQAEITDGVGAGNCDLAAANSLWCISLVEALT